MNEPRKPVRSHDWTPRFDRGRHWRGRLGFVLLAMEQTIEGDMFRLAPPGVGVHFARAPMANAITVTTLEAMADGLAAAASLILPDGHPDVVCSACTSGTIVIGEDRVIAELSRGAPDCAATTIATGAVEGLRALGARRIVVGAPYVDEINQLERDYLAQRGFDVLDIKGLNIRDDADMARVAPEFLIEFAKAIDRPDADAIFISCGALRTLDTIDEIENAIGKPVVTSNQGMMWHCLRLAGITEPQEGYGRLFAQQTMPLKTATTVGA